MKSFYFKVDFSVGLIVFHLHNISPKPAVNPSINSMLPSVVNILTNENKNTVYYKHVKQNHSIIKEPHFIILDQIALFDITKGFVIIDSLNSFLFFKYIFPDLLF